MHRGGWNALLALVLMLLTLNAFADELEIDREQTYQLGEYVDVLEDPTAELKLSDVMGMEFEHFHGSDFNFGFSKSAYWFKLDVRPSPYASYKDWWLRIYYPLLDDIRVYGVDEYGEMLFSKVGGDSYPYDSREVDHTSFLFSIPFYSGHTTIYVRVVSTGSIQVPMVLQSAQAVIEEDQISILLTGLYYGIFIIIFLYNMIMFWYTREGNYLLYLLFMVSFIVWQLTLNGIGVKYLWGEWEWMSRIGPPVSTALGALTAILFSRSFLQMETYLPRLDMVLSWIMYLCAFVAASTFVLPYTTVIIMSAAIASVLPLLLLGAGIYTWLNYFRPARFYVMGWSSFLLGTVVVSLNHYGILTGFHFFSYAQQLGSALEMIFLSWALADRVKLMQDEYVVKLSTLNVTLQEKVAASVEKEREKDKMLMEQSRMAAMGEMIEQIAHQWRQPLNTMALIMQNLFVKVHLKQVQTEDFDKAHEQINANLQYMSGTIDDFRNFHQMGKETGRVAVEEVIDMAVSLNEASLKYSNIHCEVHSDREHFIEASKSELVQIFMNLIKNSRDAMIEQPMDQGRIDIAVEEHDGVVEILVEDNAGGIPDGIIDKIFDPYFTTKSHSKGTGLGLYMSRSIVEENMNGSLSVSNGPMGARFSIILPVANGGDTQAHEQGNSLS